MIKSLKMLIIIIKKINDNTVKWPNSDTTFFVNFFHQSKGASEISRVFFRPFF